MSPMPLFGLLSFHAAPTLPSLALHRSGAACTSLHLPALGQTQGINHIDPAASSVVNLPKLIERN